MATRLVKDIQYLQRHIASQTNGQAKVTDVDDNMEFIYLDILPNDGFYRGAKIRFKLYVTESYPAEVPQVVCLDQVYHPNIDVVQYDDLASPESSEVISSNVCVSLLDEWEPSMGLDHVVMAILFLMYNPNPGDALSPYFDSSDMDMDILETNIRSALEGGSVDDIEFPCLLVTEEVERDQTAAAQSMNGENGYANNSNKEANESDVDGVVESQEVTSPNSENTPDVKEINLSNLENSPNSKETTTGDSENNAESNRSESNKQAQSAEIKNNNDISSVFMLDETGKLNCQNFGLTNIINTVFPCRFMIRTLFSSFHQRNGALHFQADRNRNIRTVDECDDCDVD